MYGCVIIREIVWHCLDLFLNLCRIRAFLKHDKALAGMLFSCRQFRVLSVSNSFQRCFHRDRVLLRILYAFYSADRVRMSLAYALPPECVILSFRKDGIRIQTVQGEHARIPAHGDDTDFISFLCRCIHVCVMLRDPCVCVKAVDHIEHARKLRRLHRKVCGAPAAQDHNIDLLFPVSRVRNTAHRHILCQDLYIPGIPAGKYCRKLHIRILLYRAFHASSKISIT